MARNLTNADNGRVRYVGRDFDLYFQEDDGTLITLSKATENAKSASQDLDTYLSNLEAYKLVASTNCTFNSSATFETIVDKSTSKSGEKQLQSVDWSFSSDNNIATISDVKNLLKAHKAGHQLYVMLGIASQGQDIKQVDEQGSHGNGSDSETVCWGWCVIQSITLNAQDGSLATFSMTLEGSGDLNI